MSKNWREKRRDERLQGIEESVKELRAEAREDEKLIKMIESPLVTVFSGPRETKHHKGTTVETRGLCLNTPNDRVVVEVGTNGLMGDGGLTVVSITGLLGERSSFSAVSCDSHNVELIFKGKDSLLQVAAVLKAIGAIFSEELIGSLKSSIDECAKEEVKKNGGKR